LSGFFLLNYQIAGVLLLCHQPVGEKNISFYVAKYVSGKCVVYLYNNEKFTDWDELSTDIQSRLEELPGQSSYQSIMFFAMIVVFFGATLTGHLPLDF